MLHKKKNIINELSRTYSSEETQWWVLFLSEERFWKCYQLSHNLISFTYSDIIALSFLKEIYLNNLRGKEYSKYILLG